MTDLWASLIITIWFVLIIAFISDKIGFSRWMYNCYCIFSKKVSAKQESIQNLQPLDLTNIDTNPFYLKENWANDYNSVYDNGKLVYTNLKVRKCDLDKLIKESYLCKIRYTMKKKKISM